MMCWHISKAIAMVSFAISTSLQSGIYLIKRLLPMSQEAGWSSFKNMVSRSIRQVLYLKFGVCNCGKFLILM
jgi:hypothetical protein